MTKGRMILGLHICLWLGAIFIMIQLFCLLPSTEQETNTTTNKVISKDDSTIKGIETKINIIKAIGVIVAAMLASTGVMLTINNTNRIEKDKVERNINKFKSLAKKLREIIVTRETSLEIMLPQAESNYHIPTNQLLGLAKGSYGSQIDFTYKYTKKKVEIDSFINSKDYIKLGIELPKLIPYLENALKILVEEDSFYSSDFNEKIKDKDLQPLLNTFFEAVKSIDDFNKKLNMPITNMTPSEVIVDIFHIFRDSQKHLRELKNELEKYI